MSFKNDRRADTRNVEADRREVDDRRRMPRVLINLEVDYGHEETFLYAHITDLSPMGIFVSTETPEEIGTHLNLRFSPPGLDSILELEGEVAWINPYRPGHANSLNPGMGVKFVGLTTEERALLKGLVRTIAYLGDESEETDPSDSN